MFSMRTALVVIWGVLQKSGHGVMISVMISGHGVMISVMIPGGGGGGGGGVQKHWWALKSMSS